MGVEIIRITLYWFLNKYFSVFRIVHKVEVETPPPQPWLEVRDITGESAELVWNLPGVRTRNQGSGSNPEGLIIPIQGYIISYRHQNLVGFHIIFYIFIIKIHLSFLYKKK